MTDLAIEVSALSAEKRQLLEILLAQEGSISDAFPLSFAQQRLWFMEQLQPETPWYNVPAAVRMTGTLHARALERSLNEILNRHETLRTTFAVVEGQPVQRIAPRLTLPLPVVNLQALTAAEREAEVQRRAREEAQRPFDLAQGPLLRATLLSLEDDEHVLLLTMHHIISDGWSLGVFMRELAALYAAYTSGKPSPLPALPIQYADFAVWQREWLRGDVLETQLSYWKDQLSGPPPALELPTDRRRPTVQSFRGARHPMALAESLTGALTALSRRQGVTLFMTLLTAFKVLLQRYTGQDDICVGSPIANRTRQETEGLIGFFVNTLVLRTDLSGNPRFRDLLARVRESCLGAYAHQDLPFEKLVEALHPVRDGGRNPLFQVMLALQNAPMPALELSGLTLRPLEIDSGVAKFDLTLNLEEGADGLHGWFEYNTDLFDAATIARMAGHFQTLLAGIADGPDTAIGQLPLLSPAERHQLLVEWNATATPYPQQCGIHDLVAAQAARTPEAEALIAADVCLTYRELDQRANQLAHHLRALGVGPDVRVAINLPRSAALVVGLLGILKAGGAYVPLDPSYPAERLAFMLADAQAPLLLTAPSALGIGLLSEALQHVQVVDLEAEGPRIARQPTTPPASGVAGENLAYVLYTSGSTGVPKGVAVPHRAVNRLVCNTNYIRLDSTDCVAQLSNCAFDAATFEIWGALVHGARLTIFATDIILAPHEFATHLTQRGVTVLFLTTALFNQLARIIPTAFRQVRSLLVGGEAADPRWLAEVLKQGPPQRLLNVYGPTETTTFATWYLVERVSEGVTTIPIGRPIANTQVYVLDRHLQPVPIGIAGELYIAGDGLARGYLNRPELTAERFIVAPRPLSQTTRLYRTGDMVRYLPDGNLEFLGRFDNQVKIRGFRIELGELESLLRQHPNVLESAVVMHEETPGDKRLAAYVAWNPRSDGGRPSPASAAAGSTHRQWATTLREYVRQQVPEYMVPSAFVIVEALPLTPNGKVDRRALPPLEMTHDELETSFVGPRNPMEQALAAIWARALRCERVGIHHNFFDLGGHSLLATEVIAAVRDTLGVEVPLRHLFERPTIAGLAEAIEQVQRSGRGLLRPTIVPVSREAHRVKLSELTSRAGML